MYNIVCIILLRFSYMFNNDYIVLEDEWKGVD